jgi:hypothetical protein
MLHDISPLQGLITMSGIFLQIFRGSAAGKNTEYQINSTRLIKSGTMEWNII